jgi:hypothetical protein
MDRSTPPAIGPRRSLLRLEPRFRTVLYTVVAVLFGTGAGWFAVDRLKGAAAGTAWQETSTWLLMLHGGAAMLFLLLLGALVALHVRVGWRLRNNRVSGAVMLTVNALLIVTAFGLYYAGSDTLRRWTSDIHIAIGLGFPVLLALHAFLGKRSVQAAQREAAARAAEDSPTARRAAALR